MRILYLADIRFPLERANGIQTMCTCHALAERGHHVTLSVRRDTVDPPRDPFAYYGLAPAPSLAITRHDLVGPRWWRRAAYLGRAVLDTCVLLAPDVVLTRDLGVASMLTRLPRESRPPVVYESHGYAPAVSADLHLRVTGAPAVSAAKIRRLAARERRVWRAAEGYATMTRALADELTSRFGPRPCVEVVPDAVALHHDRAVTAPAPGTTLVAYAGHLYPWKGVEVLLDAVALLPGVTAIVIGGHPGEPDLARLQARAARLGIESRVRFTGLVAPPAVRALLDEAAVLVLPNVATAISAAYTSPLKLFEYMAAGRPIVASDLPAIREILDDESAVLVAAGGPEALAAGIARVLADPAFAHRLAQRALATVGQHSWARRAERLERVLRC